MVALMDSQGFGPPYPTPQQLLRTQEWKEFYEELKAHNKKPLERIAYVLEEVLGGKDLEWIGMYDKKQVRDAEIFQQIYIYTKDEIAGKTNPYKESRIILEELRYEIKDIIEQNPQLQLPGIPKNHLEKLTERFKIVPPKDYLTFQHY